MDAVAYASFISPVDNHLVSISQWTVQDYIKEQKMIWKPYLVDKKDKSPKTLVDAFPEKINTNQYPEEY